MMGSLNLRMTKKLSLKGGGKKEALYFNVVWPGILCSCFLIHFSMEGKGRGISVWLCISSCWPLMPLSFLLVFCLAIHSSVKIPTSITSSRKKNVTVLGCSSQSYTWAFFFLSFFFCKGCSFWGGEYVIFPFEFVNIIQPLLWRPSNVPT